MYGLLFPLYRPAPVTNILSNNTFTAGDVTVRRSEGATVIVGSQVGNTIKW